MIASKAATSTTHNAVSAFTPQSVQYTYVLVYNTYALIKTCHKCIAGRPEPTPCYNPDGRHYSCICETDRCLSTHQRMTANACVRLAVNFTAALQFCCNL